MINKTCQHFYMMRKHKTKYLVRRAQNAHIDGVPVERLPTSLACFSYENIIHRILLVLIVLVQTRNAPGNFAAELAGV